MGKRRKLSHGQPKNGSAGKKHKQQKQQQQEQSGSSSKNASTKPSSAHAHKQPPGPEPTIPFAPEDKILLVGDGDLSFAASLLTHHYCLDVTATVLEKSALELTDKYPHVGDNITLIEAAAEEGACTQILYGVDATKMAPFAASADKQSDNGSGRGGGRNSEGGVMDRIIFNFPHVGGKSTDVNRQVRHNQSLLVSFFERALPSLSPRPGSSIVVTLFEGEPYTLWNVRDLARHCGLAVQRSFAFRADAYPGYRHARTLGAVRNREGEVVEGGGAWRGEERAARSYVFVRKEDVAPPPGTGKGKKRGRWPGGESEDSD